MEGVERGYVAYNVTHTKLLLHSHTLALMQWHFYYRPKRRRGLFTATLTPSNSSPCLSQCLLLPHLVSSGTLRSGPSGQWCQFLSCALTVNLLDTPRPHLLPSPVVPPPSPPLCPVPTLNSLSPSRARSQNNSFGAYWCTYELCQLAQGRGGGSTMYP